MSACGASKEGMKSDKYQEEAAAASKAEKEEGELSPEHNSEEDDFIVHEDVGTQTVPKDKHSIQNYQTQNNEVVCEDTAPKNDIDADEDDSDNASENGENVSGSESAGDDCSREEREEDDDVECDEVDGKAESEGEAEGMDDGHLIGEDGASLSVSEHFLLSVRPLAKRVSAVGLQERRKDSRVFYGNDDFYVLFRLHQVRKYI